MPEWVCGFSGFATSKRRARNFVLLGRGAQKIFRAHKRRSSKPIKPLNPLVSVLEVLESDESFVIQGWWPDS